MITKHTCDYCGLVFDGKGLSPEKSLHFCCIGCYLVWRITGSQSEEGIATWILLRLGIGAFLSMNVMMISLVLYFTDPAEISRDVEKSLYWAMAILSTPAIIILGAPYLSSSIQGIRRWRINSDVLIFTGSFTAFAISIRHTIICQGHVYYDTATMLLLIVTLGRLMEASAKNHTSQVLKGLMDIAPQTAHVRRNQQEIEVPASEVVKGDIVLIRPGEKAPADGIIKSGECYVEESAFTGEPGNHLRKPGDRIYGGSIICGGFIEVEANAAGCESLLSQMQEIVRKAQQEQSTAEKLADRVSSMFVPFVVLLAIGAGVYWGLLHRDIGQAVMSSLAVLAVACPCALGIATPMVSCLAMACAAGKGILIRSADALDKLHRVTHIFFDKTGTLTDSELSVKEIKTASDFYDQDMLLLAGASIEAGSEHSIAKAIVSESRSRGQLLSKVDNFKAYPGRGAAGEVHIDGKTHKVFAGSLEFLSEYCLLNDHLDLPDELARCYIGWDGSIKGVITLSASVRPEAAQIIDLLTAKGLYVTVISGDGQGAVQCLSDQLGIESSYYNCSPVVKAELVRAGRKFGTVAVVGDGINDAPALAEADVGIAAGSGTDLAREASDITLIGDDLLRIPWLVDLSQTVNRIIKQNLVWSFGYNTVAMILAFFGYVHPLIAALAMFGSSIAVILNSLRLLKWEGMRDEE